MQRFSLFRRAFSSSERGSRGLDSKRLAPGLGEAELGGAELNLDELLVFSRITRKARFVLIVGFRFGFEAALVASLVNADSLFNQSIIGGSTANDCHSILDILTEITIEFEAFCFIV